MPEVSEETDELPDDLRVPGDDNPDMGPGFDLEAHNAKAAEALGQAPAVEEAAEPPAEAPAPPSPAADTNGASEPPAEPQGAAEPA